MQRLKKVLKPRFQLIGISTLFLTATTTMSLILICVPTWISPNIDLKEISWGSAILGSIFGQFTLLMFFGAGNRIIKKISDWVEKNVDWG